MIAYLINTYPLPSCTFIRREIKCLEASGKAIARFALREPETKPTEASELSEWEKTQFVLNVGLIGLLLNLLRVAIIKPVRFFKALNLALKIGWHSEKGIFFHLIYLAEACVLLQWLLKLPITHLHAHFGTNATTVAMLCHILGGPTYSFTVHGPEEFDKIKGIALPEKIKRAAFVVAVSLFSCSQLYRWCDYTQWSKIHLIHCGLEKTFLSFPEQPIPDIPQFVCIGRLSEQKGQLLLVEAVSRLITEGYSLKVILVGDGLLKEAILKKIQEKKLEKNIELTGWATEAEVQRQILASRAMILPSFAEGLPVVIMESLALGRPVISTYIAGIPELVIPEVSGWLIPAGSVEALVEAMRTTLQTPVSELEKMGKLGAEQVRQQHDLEQEVKKLALLLEKMPEKTNSI